MLESMEQFLETMKEFLASDKRIADEYPEGHTIRYYYAGAASRDELFIQMLQHRIDAEKQLSEKPDVNL